MSRKVGTVLRQEQGFGVSQIWAEGPWSLSDSFNPCVSQCLYLHDWSWYQPALRLAYGEGSDYMGLCSLLHVGMGDSAVGGGISLGKGEEDEDAEPGSTPRLRAAVDVGQAAGLMRSFINIMFGAMMDLPSSPAWIFWGKGH